MGNTLFIAVPIVVVVAAAFVLFLVLGGRKRTGGEKKSRNRDRASLVRDANRRLAQNPRDGEALKILADVYYQDEQFDKAVKSYEVLVDLCATNKELDEFEITVKYAISALRTKHMKEAYKSLLIARTMRQDVFEINHHLGYLEYLRKNYEKAASLLAQALTDQPDHPDTLKYLGMSQFRIKRYDDAAKHLRRSLDLSPDDKESLFTLGQCHYELNQNDRALKILTHLRADPVVGPNAALFAGTLHLKMHRMEDAAMDFEIGLRHPNIKNEVKAELKYRLAGTYIQMQNLTEGIRHLEEINREQPKYRDVEAQLSRYRELSLNSHLQTYLLGSTSDFVTLCRKLSTMFFPDASVKIVDISVQKSESADILAEVSTSRWEDVVLFRYIRTSSKTGDLALRDMYARLKEVKAGRGICCNAGGFTDTAQQFVEARLIDLIEKEPLVKMLNRLSTWTAPA
jgi:tetratricopeptide (TPR) repeat protein